MMLTWLADELRAAGLKVIEVDGWKTRGSSAFDPIGVTWHATAGSRTATAQGELNVLLYGSTTAPPPISQLMLWRDGTFYVVAAGRANHNKVGWDGPNRGLGNSSLLGIEMANDNRGELWSPAQLQAARIGTAAIMRRLGADPMRRLAAHYEHQPYATRPPGEGSTKSDPFGIVMARERPIVAALAKEVDMTPAETLALLKTWAASPEFGAGARAAVLGYDPGRDAKGAIPGDAIPDKFAPAFNAADPKTYGKGVGTISLAQAIGQLRNRADQEFAEVTPSAEQVATAVTRALSPQVADEAARDAALRALVERLFAQGLATTPVTLTDDQIDKLAGAVKAAGDSAAEEARRQVTELAQRLDAAGDALQVPPQ